MKIHRRSILLAAAAVATPSLRAQSKGWPAKSLRIVVPYPPGGSSDIIARAISQPLSEALRQSVIVDNKPGANGNLGADLVAKSPPDGYTLLLCDVGALAISPSVYTRLQFDPSKDLRGVTMLAYSPHLLVVHPSVQASNLKELVALSKQKDLNFAVSATGGAPHLAGVALERASGARWQYVPYKGGIAGDPGHDRRADPGHDERHAGHAAACAKRQAESPGCLQALAHALDRRRSDHRRARRPRFRIGHLARRAGGQRHARRAWCSNSTPN